VRERERDSTKTSVWVESPGGRSNERDREILLTGQLTTGRSVGRSVDRSVGRPVSQRFDRIEPILSVCLGAMRAVRLQARDESTTSSGGQARRATRVEVG